MLWRSTFFAAIAFGWIASGASLAQTPGSAFNWDADPDQNAAIDPAIPVDNAAPARDYTRALRGVMSGVAQALGTLGQPNGIAALDNFGKLPVSQLPLPFDGSAGVTSVVPNAPSAVSLALRGKLTPSLYDYGAKCDGATHPLSASYPSLAAAKAVYPAAQALTDELDHVALQSAFNNAALIPVVMVPPGGCRTAGGLTASTAITLRGMGFAGATGAVITTTSATADTLTATAQFVYLENIYFNASVTRTAGSYVRLTANRAFLENIFCDTPFVCVTVAGPNVIYINRLTNYWYAQPQAQSRILEVSGNSGDVRLSRAFSVGPAGAGPLAAVYITGSGAVWINDSTFERTGTGLFVKTDPNSIGVASVRTTATFFDNMQNVGVDILADTKAVNRVDFGQSWTSSTANGPGVRLRTVNGGTIGGVTFNQHHSFLNAGNGFEINDPGVKDVRINNSQAAGNTGSGAYFAAGVSGFSITASQMGAVQGLNGNARAVTIGAGSTKFALTDNDFSGNTAAPTVLSPTSPTEVIENNVGFPTPWTNYTPTLTATSGTITTLGTLSGRYRYHGSICELWTELKITTNGTGAGTLNTTLPCAPYGPQAIPANERTTGALLSGVGYNANTTAEIRTATGAYAGKDGADIVLSGQFGTQ